MTFSSIPCRCQCTLSWCCHRCLSYPAPVISPSAACADLGPHANPGLIWPWSACTDGCHCQLHCREDVVLARYVPVKLSHLPSSQLTLSVLHLPAWPCNRLLFALATAVCCASFLLDLWLPRHTFTCLTSATRHSWGPRTKEVSPFVHLFINFTDQFSVYTRYNLAL
jgi:hypothetical protein